MTKKSSPKSTKKGKFPKKIKLSKISPKVKVALLIALVLVIIGGIASYCFINLSKNKFLNIKSGTIMVTPNSAETGKKSFKITIWGKRVKFIKDSQEGKTYLKFVRTDRPDRNKFYFPFPFFGPSISVKNFKVVQEASWKNLYVAKAEAEIDTYSLPSLRSIMEPFSKNKIQKEYHYELIVYNTYPDKRKGEEYETDFTLIEKK